MSDEIPYPPDELPPEEWENHPDADVFDEAEQSAARDDDFRLLSAQDFDAALEALQDYSQEAEDVGTEAPEESEEIAADTLVEELAAPEDVSDGPLATEPAAAEEAFASPPPPTIDAEERVRPPRARRFRRTLRNQIGMLPLALGLLALGAYLIAHAQNVRGLPELSRAELAGLGVLVLGFTAFFHALLFGRRERGLVFLGVWIWVTAGALAVLVYVLDPSPDAAVWWPVLLWSTALTFVLTYLVERTHDARLLLLSMMALVAGTTAYLVTSERIGADLLDEAASYWPLLLTVIGVGVLPVAFRRRAE